MGVKFLLFILAPYLFKNVTNIFQTQDINDSKAISISNNSRKKISVLLDMGESMLVKSDRVHGYSEKSGIKKCKSIFFNFNNPIISIFSGLTEMDMYTNKSEKSVCFDIKPLTPYEYFTELKFENCKGAFIVPKSIVGISPTLQLNTKWCIKNFLYTGRLRYYFVTGTGKILLSADGGVLKLQDMQNYRITEKSNIIFMDLSLNTQAIRTDICYNYVMRNAELFDVSVSGNGIVLIRNNSGDNNFGQKMMSTDSFLNVIGHLLGF